jgi:hypothetical protein
MLPAISGLIPSEQYILVAIATNDGQTEVVKLQIYVIDPAATM